MENEKPVTQQERSFRQLLSVLAVAAALTAAAGCVYYLHSWALFSSVLTGLLAALFGIFWHKRDISERKKAQEALQRSEAKTRAIVNAMPDLLFVLSRDGIFLEYKAEKMTELFLPPEDFLGRNIRDVLPEPVARLIMEHVEQAFRSGRATCEYQLPIGEQPRYFEARMVQSAPATVLCIVRDIAERKRAENAARERAELLQLKLDMLLSPGREISGEEIGQIVDFRQFQELLDLLHVPIGILDLKGNILVASGWQDICTKYHRCHPETREHCIESDHALSVKVGEGQYLEHKCRNNMWDIVTPIVVGGKHVANIFLGQFFYEGEEIDYAFFEEQADRYGFDRQAYMAALRQVPRMSRERVREIMEFYVRFAGLISQLSYRNIQLARSLVEQKLAEDALRQSEELLRRNQEELREANDRLEEKVARRTAELLKARDELNDARRLSDIGRLAASIAHEMRNPLAAISTALYNIRRKAGDAPVAGHIATIEKKVRESDQIISNLLNFSHIKTPSCERVSAAGLLREAIATVAPKYERRDVRLSKKLDLKAGDRIEADPVQLGMLFCNVLDNAFQAAPDKTGTVHVAAAMKQGALEVTVADNGGGVDADDLHRLGEPFFSRKSRGTGLGLAVCRQIITMHAGGMTFESEKGKGTTVRITLPREYHLPQRRGEEEH